MNILKATPIWASNYIYGTPTLDTQAGPTPTSTLTTNSNSLTLFYQKDEAKSYLALTDWYIIRELDNGVPCPQEIKDARELARSKVIN